jgi:deoxyxylulose-5-phosphate synthase
LYEALDAYEELRKDGIFIRVIDLYSVKPPDRLTLKEAAEAAKILITVEDHFAEGVWERRLKAFCRIKAYPFILFRFVKYREVENQTNCWILKKSRKKPSLKK